MSFSTITRQFGTIAVLPTAVTVTFLHATGDVLLLELNRRNGHLADARDGELDGSIAVDSLGEEHGMYFGLDLG